MKKAGLSALVVVALAAATAFAATQTTITGTVVSSTTDQLVVKTANGNMTFEVSGGSLRPTPLAAGNRVTVWYSPGSSSGTWSLDKAEMASSDLEWDNINVVTGTVVMLDGDHLTLSTPKGHMSLDIDKNTDRPASMAAGDRITVWYDADDQIADKMDARRIAMAPATVTVVPPATTTRTTYETESQSTYTTTQEELPQTASPMPLAGALGLLTLAAAAVVRMMDHRR
jgi:hypothetical protein